MDSKEKGVQHVAGSDVDDLGVGKAWACVGAWSGGGHEDVDRGGGAL